MKILEKIIKDDKTHIYCPQCLGETICPYCINGKEFYKCNSCGYDDSRMIMIYPDMRYEILDDNELLHYSVGAVVEWEGKFLLFRRRLFPFKYTIIAGHWDLTDLTPELAIIREIREEAGIELEPQPVLFVETINEPCRRGADFHEWRLYKFEVDNHEVSMSEEADIIGWYLPDEINNLDLTIPTEYFLNKLQIL